MMFTMSSSSFGIFVSFLAPRVTSYIHCSKWLQSFWISNTWHLNLQRLLCLSESSSRFLHLSHLFSHLLHKAGESHSFFPDFSTFFSHWRCLLDIDFLAPSSVFRNSVSWVRFMISFVFILSFSADAPTLGLCYFSVVFFPCLEGSSVFLSGGLSFLLGLPLLFSWPC